jgi:hypothetical protein
VRALAAVVAATLVLSGCASATAGRPFDGATHESYYDERWSDVDAFMPDLVRPNVVPVRVVSDNAWLETVLACVTRYGLAVGERNAYEISELICEQQFPSTGAIELARTADDRESTWRYYDRVMLTCLRLHGLPVLPSPAYQNALSGGDYLWRVNEPAPPSTRDKFRLGSCPGPS